MKITKTDLKHLQEEINYITLYSAALSFYTIFSLVPLILLVSTIFASPLFFSEFYDKLQNFIISNIVPNNQELAKEYLNNFLQNSYKMGVIGIFYLIITSILFFDNYETIISKIFNRQKRDFIEKIKLYWTMITLFPILFASSIYVSVKINLFFGNFFNYFIPFMLMWLLFFLSYAFTSYYKKLRIIVFTSFITSTIFIFSKNIFIYYLKINHTYSNIYGPISILLSIFLWIYISWIIYITGLFIIKHLSK